MQDKSNQNNNQTQTTSDPAASPVVAPTPADNVASPPLDGTVLTTRPKKSVLRSKKVLATILGIAFLITSVGVGVLLVGQQQIFRIGAWDCSKYVFTVSRDGVVQTINGSTRNEPAQDASVYINNNLVATLSVPALVAGDAKTIGNVSVPTEGGFTWRVDGSKDCDDEGSYDSQVTPTPIQAQCLNIVAYDDSWTQLTADQLASLTAGDIVHFTVNGSTTSGSIDKAKFEINGTDLGETTNLKPGSSSEFFVQYTIPENTTSFTVNAQLHHTQLGWF